MNKAFFMLYFILAQVVFAGFYSGNIEDLNITENTDINESFADPVYEDKINFVGSDNLIILQDDTGENNYSYSEFNTSENLLKIMDDMKNNSASRAQSTIQKIVEKYPDLQNSADQLENYTNEKLKAIYTDQKRAAMAQKSIDGVRNLLNVFGSRDFIKCYIKRTIVPSFYCPLAGKDQSYFTGGIANTSTEDAQNECGEYCKTKETCVSRPIENANPNDEHILNYSAPLVANLSVSNTQKIQSIDLDISSSMESLSINISISGVIDGNTVQLYSNYEVKLILGEQRITLPLKKRNLTSLKIVILKPFTYELSKKTKDIISTPGIVVLKNANIIYYDSKYWFCPAAQFVSNRSDCESRDVESIVAGGSPVLLCLKSKDLIREPRFGAYYSQETCEAECFSSAECLPTYKYLTSSLTASIYNVDYGCMPGQDNDSCTKDLCKEKIFNNEMPGKETVYYNDNVAEVTVLDGQIVEGAVRPTYNISAEMSTNNDTQAKKELMTSTSKDMAYKNMLSERNFVVSDKNISYVYPLQTKATRINFNGVSVEYLPRSDLFNRGANSFVYFIIANEYKYSDEYIEQININTGVNSGESFFKSTNYTILNSDRTQKLFYIADKEEIYVNDVGFQPYSLTQEIEKTLAPDGTLTSYNTGDIANPTVEKNFTVSQHLYSFTIAENYFEYANNTEGTSLKSQVTDNGIILKKYSGPKLENGGVILGYKVFLITSDRKITYREIIDSLKNNTIHIAYDHSSSVSYSKSIKGHANVQYDSENIKIFLLGNSRNMSAIGEFKPSFSEEGKEAFIFNFLYNKN